MRYLKRQVNNDIMEVAINKKGFPENQICTSIVSKYMLHFMHVDILMPKYIPNSLLTGIPLTERMRLMDDYLSM